MDETKNNYNSSSVKLSCNPDDLYKMYGSLLLDQAVLDKQHKDEMELLNKKMEKNQKIYLSIIYCFTAIMISIIVGSAILLCTKDKSSNSFGNIEMYDSSSFDSTDETIDTIESYYKNSDMGK
jgi:hypothetical protein